MTRNDTVVMCRNNVGVECTWGAVESPACKRCGFNPAEEERRKKLPLVAGKDGLRRKIIRRNKNGN